MTGKTSFLYFGITLLLLNACVSTKISTPDKQKQVNLDTVDVKAGLYKKYNPSETRKNNLLHTKLEVKFDWEKHWLYGKATLTLSPYFYHSDKLELDAKGFDVHEVSLLTDTGKINLNYSYLPLEKSFSRTGITSDTVQSFEKKILSVELDKEYSRKDTFDIYIEYTAKPDELKTKGSSAIKDAKGLYFINPDGKEEGKPRQIWTQGETESNSCWFPTIDSPNERMTQEIYITIDTNFVTLSNGLLIYSSNNGDGTRTDYWKQELPHAPYLAMLAIGEYAVVKDKWRDIEVNYYVEPKDAEYAMLNFGNTPEMLEFFSNKLGVDYPWGKYSQVVVRDFVSGAMENTSATLHGEFVIRNDREYLDRNHEDIMSHELFHQWFGDLVTCESWANIPLNESFATYGEYLWEEYKYGSDAAEHHIQQDLQQYLQSSARKQVNVIRFDYDDKEDMFDSHSYAKGGRILHMLRKYVGDEAFFESLKNYLSVNKFSAVEIHDLRLAFEKVTGEDMNWFFNQWFLSSGYPLLVMNYHYDDSLKQQSVSVWQVQKLDNTPLYKLPVAIDIYMNGKKERHKAVIDSVAQTFTFDVSSKPDLVNFDAEKMLLCAKRDEKTRDEWIFQYYNAPMYLDRYEAIEELSKKDDSLSAKTIIDALNDKYWNIKILAMQNMKYALVNDKAQVKQKLIALAQNDEKAPVRSAAIKHLARNFSDIEGKDDAVLGNIYRNAINDKAYSVISAGLTAMAKINYSEAMDLVNTLDEPTREAILLAIAEIYAEHGTDEQNDFFQKNFTKVNQYEKYALIELYGKYLLRQNDTTINKGLGILEDATKNEKIWWARLTALDKITEISELYNTREKVATEEIRKNKGGDAALIRKLEEQLSNINSQKKHIAEIIDKIKESEKDSRVLKFFDGD